MISMIAAIGENRAIGKDNQMLWHMPADFKWFKQQTIGKPIVMGRKTFESIGKPLPQRQNIVLSRSSCASLEAMDVDIFHSIEQISALATQHPEIMIIGGAQIYQQFLSITDRLYLTLVEQSFEADSFFPDYSSYQWRQTFKEFHQADEKNAYNYSFVILERVQSSD